MGFLSRFISLPKTQKNSFNYECDHYVEKTLILVSAIKLSLDIRKVCSNGKTRDTECDFSFTKYPTLMNCYIRILFLYFNFFMLLDLTDVCLFFLFLTKQYIQVGLLMHVIQFLDGLSSHTWYG
jgi:hypothetical protein